MDTDDIINQTFGTWHVIESGGVCKGLLCKESTVIPRIGGCDNSAIPVIIGIEKERDVPDVLIDFRKE